MQIASAPGKAILSGEHSVVHGAPALAVSLEQRLTVRYTPDRLPRLSWMAPDRVHEMAIEKISSLRHRLDNAFEGYLKGERSISEILSRPAELVFYTVDMARILGDLKQLPSGKVEIHSDIPIGSGMGSSAALLAAILSMFGRAKNSDDLIRQVRHCERLQHGKGSLIDAAAVTLGGLVRVEGDSAVRLEYLPTQLNTDWFWIHTGTPVTSTGECVEQVRRHFSGSDIWNEFAQVTQAFELALQQQLPLGSLVRENHRLLNRIGVVPARVSALIERIEQSQGAAKVSGAGAVAGEAAGLVLAWMPNGSPADLELPRDYRWGALKVSTQGAVLDD